MMSYTWVFNVAKMGVTMVSIMIIKNITLKLIQKQKCKIRNKVVIIVIIITHVYQKLVGYANYTYAQTIVPHEFRVTFLVEREIPVR